ncbi:MAG: hypothetical protein GXW85_06000 [Clostridia bacterium]|nr:hypothetical protein [Clostridia bacterium]
MHNYQQRSISPTQMVSAQNAPNASIATMGPDTFQNSPYNQGGFTMGNPGSQLNQQQQEQNYLQNVRQQLNSQQQFTQQPNYSMFSQRPIQQIQTQQNQPFQTQMGSLATMGPSTYQNFQAFQQQQHRSTFAAQPQMNYQQTAPNASIATMGPETFQNSPYNQGGFNMGNPSAQLNQQQQEQNYLQNVRQQLINQYSQQQFTQQPNYSMFSQRPVQQIQAQQNQPFQNQMGSLATMDPSTDQNFQAFQQQQQHRSTFAAQPQMNYQQTAPNASIATMGPETFQNSPYNQGGFNMGNPSAQLNQQQQEQNYLQNVRQQLINQPNQFDRIQ